MSASLFVINENDLKNYPKRGDVIFLFNEVTYYICRNSKWNNNDLI